jgi:hypothetical protein
MAAERHFPQFGFVVFFLSFEIIDSSTLGVEN